MMDMTVECLDCQKRFQFEESLVVHQSVCMKHQETKTRTRVTCEQCGKTFKSLTSLRNHARTHTDYFNVTKEEFDRTLRSSLDVTNNILESTRTSEADTSDINRSLDISAVTCSDISVVTCSDISAVTCSSSNSTYVCSSYVSNATLTDDLLDVSAPFIEDKSPNNTYVLHKPTPDTAVDNEDVIPLDKTYIWDGGRRLSPDRTYLVQQPEADVTITEEAEETPMDITRVISREVANDKPTNITRVISQEDTSDIPTNTTRVISDQVTTALPNDVTRVISNHSTSGQPSNADQVTTDLPGDVTRVISKQAPNDAPNDRTCVISDEVASDAPCDTTHALAKPVTSRRTSGIPIPSINRNSKLSPLTTKPNNIETRTGRSASIKSIRTLRTDRSKSRTPVKNNKNRGTPSKSTRSKSRSRTPTTSRSSKYAVRITSGISYSPFRLTPLSPKLTPLSKKKNLDVATYKCKKCGKTFNDKDQYDIHYVIHVRDTPAKCGIPSECYKKNSRKLQFSTPERKVQSTPTTKQSHVCPHCHQSYQTERYLISHMKIHFIDVPFVCNHCDKRFKYAQSLRAHAITHTGEEANRSKDTDGIKSAKCNERNSENFTEVLEKMNISLKVIDSFKDDAVIRDLLELPYTCNSCSYKTSQPVNLLKHMQTHSRARPYKCTQCDKSYKTKSNLELHAKVHMIGKLRTLITDRRNSVMSGVKL